MGGETEESQEKKTGEYEDINEIDETGETGDPLHGFMVVPAVPDRQYSRTPKDYLNSLQLNLNIPNSLDVPPASRSQKVKSDVTSSSLSEEREDERKDFRDGREEDVRRRFRQCQSECVHQLCVPVNDLTVYNVCVNNCRNLCV